MISLSGAGGSFAESPASGKAKTHGGSYNSQCLPRKIPPRKSNGKPHLARQHSDKHFKRWSQLQKIRECHGTDCCGSLQTVASSGSLFSMEGQQTVVPRERAGQPQALSLFRHRRRGRRGEAGPGIHRRPSRWWWFLVFFWGDGEGSERGRESRGSGGVSIQTVARLLVVLLVWVLLVVGVLSWELSSIDPGTAMGAVGEHGSHFQNNTLGHTNGVDAYATAFGANDSNNEQSNHQGSSDTGHGYGKNGGSIKTDDDNEPRSYGDIEDGIRLVRVRQHALKEKSLGLTDGADLAELAAAKDNPYARSGGLIGDEAGNLAELEDLRLTLLEKKIQMDQNKKIRKEFSWQHKGNSKRDGSAAAETESSQGRSEEHQQTPAGDPSDADRSSSDNHAGALDPDRVLSESIAKLRELNDRNRRKTDGETGD